METQARSSAMRVAALFLLVGLLWFLAAELAAARLVGPEAGDTVRSAARWGFPAVAAGLAYLLVRRTDRRVERVADRLGGTRELLHQAVRSMHDALFVVDVEERRIVSCNPAAQEMFGYEREAMIGASTRLLHVDDEHWRRFAAKGDPVVAQGETWRGGFEMARADGERLHTEHAVTLLEEAADERVLAVSVVRDMSQRVELEDRLRRQTKRQRAILANVSDLVTVVDRETRILYANPPARDLLGWEPDDLVGRIGFELVHPDDRERIEGAFRETLREGEGRARYRFRRGDGGWALVESRGAVTDAEELTGTVLVTRLLAEGVGEAG